MTALQAQEQRKETKRQEPEDGYFGRDSDGTYCYESAHERGGEVPTQDLIEMNEIIHITRNVTREYSHRMGCIVDLLNNKKIELEQVDQESGLIEFVSGQLLYDRLCDGDSLDKIFSCLDITKIPHADEIMEATMIMEEKCYDELIKHKNLHGSYLTADFPLYVFENGEAILYLAKRENNPMFYSADNLRDALYQLLRTHNYKPKKEDVERVINTDSTLKIPLSKLNLENRGGLFRWSDDEIVFCYFKIDVAHIEQLNPTQRALAERVYGKGENFDRITHNLKEMIDKKNAERRITDQIGTKQISLAVLTPEYVEHRWINYGKRAISRPSILGNYRDESSFDVRKWTLDDHYLLLHTIIK
ncbi:hypothetical protein HY636_01810 [Candidatus Woesearchaeota archaeon]|nr:hypothetical protein [Candidatus Woesearchaeota archaeon]